MRILEITISNEEYESLGLKSLNVSYSDFVDLISKQLSQQKLKKSIELAEIRKRNEENNSFKFLDDEENSYSVADLKVLYNSKK